MFHLELGNGWKLAVLDSQEEYEFIRQGQRSFNNSVPYWIDGSANATLNEFFNYIDYIADNSGSCDNEYFNCVDYTANKADSFHHEIA